MAIRPPPRMRSAVVITSLHRRNSAVLAHRDAAGAQSSAGALHHDEEGRRPGLGERALARRDLHNRDVRRYGDLPLAVWITHLELAPGARGGHFSNGTVGHFRALLQVPVVVSFTGLHARREHVNLQRAPGSVFLW